MSNKDHIVVLFRDAGTPKTGLTATIDIFRTDTQAQVVTAGSFTEIALGLYVHDFTGRDPALAYAIRADGSATLTDPNERYQGGSLAPGSFGPTTISGLNVVEDLQTLGQISFWMRDADGVGVAGLSGSMAVTLSKNGGAFGSITPTITDRSNGQYSMKLAAANLDTPGAIVFRITDSAAEETIAVGKVLPRSAAGLV